MEIIKNIFSNQWVINIGTGIIVYIFTSIVSKIILNKATNKEKQKQVDNANKTIIRILKPYVVDKNILNEMIINSIIEDVAREYNLSVNEIFNAKVICEELTREILESSYVDNERKREYILYLHSIIENHKSIEEINENITMLSETTTQLKRYRNIYSIISICMLTIVLIISISVTSFSEREYEFWISMSEPMQITMLILVAEIGIMFPTIILILKNTRKNRKKELE